MLTSDQITALAPDAASLKAGRDLATPRKWETSGGDDEVLWGLAMGSGKNPYQTQVSRSDLASKCSCPSRKFPCKHALGLMLMTVGSQAGLTVAVRPPWVVEWMASRAARIEKAATRAEATPVKPVDEKGAEKRRAKRESRVADGLTMLRQTLIDLTREGLASGVARSSSSWEDLAKRMVDAQAPGLAANLRHIADTVLRDPDVDTELPFELGRLFVLLHGMGLENADDPHQAEWLSQIGGGTGGSVSGENIEDHWFVMARTVHERDRLITITTWLLGSRTRRWAKVLRFAPVPQLPAEPWRIGSGVAVTLKFQAGLYPQRAVAVEDGLAEAMAVPVDEPCGLDGLLERFAIALAANPFLRNLPFFISLRPAGAKLVDGDGRALPWSAEAETALRVECICGGLPTAIAGEWDGRFLRVLSIRDGSDWISLTNQQP